MSKSTSTFIPDRPQAEPGRAPVGDTPGGPWSTPSPTPPPVGPGETEPAAPFAPKQKSILARVPINRDDFIPIVFMTSSTARFAATVVL